MAENYFRSTYSTNQAILNLERKILNLSKNKYIIERLELDLNLED